MQTEVFTHLSLFKIHKYVSGAKSVCDFMKKPRPCYFFAAMLEGSAVFETALGEKIPIEAGDLIFIPKGSKYRSFWNEKQENVHSRNCYCGCELDYIIYSPVRYDQVLR